MHIDELQKKAVGDFLTAADVNTIIDALRVVDHAGNGFVDSLTRSTGEKVKVGPAWFQILNDDDETIPAWSIFSIVGTPAQSEDDPVLVAAHKIGIEILNGANATFFATNGSVEIPAGEKGLARPINDYDFCRIRVTGTTTPEVGSLCGPELDTWGIDGDRYGLICAGLTTLDEASSGSGSSSGSGLTTLALVIRVPEPGSFLGVVRSAITSYDPDNARLGQGTMAVLFRNINELQPAPDPVGLDAHWVRDVYNILCEEISVGRIVKASYCTGVGLVADVRSCLGSSSLSLSSSSSRSSSSSSSSSRSSSSSGSGSVEAWDEGDYCSSLGGTTPACLKLDFTLTDLYDSSYGGVSMTQYNAAITTFHVPQRSTNACQWLLQIGAGDYSGVEIYVYFGTYLHLTILPGYIIAGTYLDHGDIRRFKSDLTAAQTLAALTNGAGVTCNEWDGISDYIEDGASVVVKASSGCPYCSRDISVAEAATFDCLLTNTVTSDTWLLTYTSSGYTPQDCMEWSTNIGGGTIFVVQTRHGVAGHHWLFGRTDVTGAWEEASRPARLQPELAGPYTLVRSGDDTYTIEFV